MVKIWIHFVKISPGPTKNLSWFKTVCKFEVVILSQPNFFCSKVKLLTIKNIERQTMKKRDKKVCTQVLFYILNVAVK